MSLSTSHAHEFVAPSPSPANALSDTEPPDEWKRQIKERINTNLQKLYQDAEELYKRRLQEVRSDDERARLKENQRLEIGRIRALGAEEYHTQLELERQQRKWAMGQPIDDKWKDALMREHRKIFESYKPSGPDSDPPDQNGGQNARSNEPAASTRIHLAQRTITVPEYNPPPLPPDIEQKKASQLREERPPPRVRRQSDPAKEEYRHAAYFPSVEDRGVYYESWARGVSDEPEGSMYPSPSKSRPSVDRSPILDRSEDDRPGTRASERPTRTGTERYVSASPVKHEIWRPNVPADEEAANSRRGLARRGSTASQRSVGSTSIRSLTAEPILERPDNGVDYDKTPRESVIEQPGTPSSLSDKDKAKEHKGKERQHQSRTLQMATDPAERWEEISVPIMGGPKAAPNSAPPVRSSSDRPPPPPPGPYYPPQRSASVKLPPLADDDRPFAYKLPRRHGSKSSFTTESIDLRYGAPPSSSSLLDDPRDYPYRSASTVHGHRPIVPKPSFNGIVDRDREREDDGRYIQDWYPGPGRRSRMGSISREYRDVEDWTGSLRLPRERDTRDRDHHSRPFFPPGPFADDSYVSYRRQSPELARPSLARGTSFSGNNRAMDDYDAGHAAPYSEAYQRSYNQSSSSSSSPSTSIPINRGKQLRPATDEYGVSSWRDWTKHVDGPPPRPSPERTSYEVYTPPSSYSLQARAHSFGGRESGNDHRRNDHVPESEAERIRLRYEELTRLEREEAAKRELAERMVREKMEEIRKQEEEARRAMEEARRTEEEARRKEEEARKKEEDARRSQEEAKRLNEEARRKEEEARRLEEEVKRKEEEAMRKGEEARRKEEEARRKEEEVRLKEEEAKIKEEEALRKEEEARRKEDEIKKKELDARRKEREAHRKEQEAKRKELEVKRMEEEARRLEEEARRREEETERREEEVERREEESLKRAAEIRKKAEEIRRREEELTRREEELLRREAESRYEEEKMRLLEEEAERQREEEARRQEEELARRREEAKREETARREDERRQRSEEGRRRREEGKRRREEERQQRLEAELKSIEEERRRLEEEKRRREEEQQRLEEERKRREEGEAARRQEEEETARRLEEERRQREEVEAAAARRQEEEERRREQGVRRQQEEQKRRRQEEEWRKEQERIHEEVMRREWEKRRNESAQQGAYDKQREEIQKRKGEERKQQGYGGDSGFTSSSPTTSGSPLSSGRPNAPQRQGSVNASAWTSAAGSAWKTSASAAASPSTPSPGSSTRSSTSSATTSATSTSSSIPTSTPTPKPKPAASGASGGAAAPPSFTESDWARRQAEQAKEQQERFRHEQEKLENQRRANEINKTLTEKDLAQLYQTHDMRWKDLNTFEVLRWDTFPWPMARRPKSAEDINESAIYAYLFSRVYPEKDHKSDKDRLKEHIKRWHPDKFDAKYLPKVIEEDQGRVKEGAGAVVRGLNGILNKINEPQQPGLFG